MDGIAERGVRFTLQVATDQAAKAELNAIARAVDVVQQKASAATASASAVLSSIPKASASGMDPSVMSAKEVNDRIQAVLANRVALHEANNAKLAQLDAQRLAAADKFATEFQAIGMQLFNEEIDATTAASMVESFSQAATEAKTQYDSFQESLTGKAAKEADKRTDKELQALKKRQQFHITETKKQVDADLKLIEDGIKKEADARRAGELAAKRQHDAQMSNYDRLNEKAKNSSRQLLTQFGEINESIMRFARGLVMVGLAGEDDMGKLTKSLVKMQGYFDFFSGSVKTLTKMNEMYRHMTGAIQAATAAQAALNLAQGLDPSGRVIRDPLNKNPSQRGGGAAIGAAASAAGGAAGGFLEASSAALLAKLAAGAKTVGGVIASAFLTTVGAGAAAIGGLIFGGNAIKEMVQGRQSSFGEAVGTSYLNPFAYVGAMNRNRVLFDDEGSKAAQAAADKTKRMEKISKPLQEMNERDNKAIDANLQSKVGIERELKTLAKERLMATLEEQKPLEKRKTIAAELRALNNAAARNEAGARSEVIEWQKKRLANEREIASERAAAAKQAATAAKNELDDVIKRQQVLREGVMSAAERFATMDPQKQREILLTQKRLSLGDKTLTTEELQAARGFGGKTDERISKTLQGRAFGAGFGAFAQESFREIAQLENTRKKLEVEVKQKLDFAVRIEGDYDALAKKIAMEIDKQQSEKVKELGKQVKTILADVTKLQASIKTRTTGVSTP